jgi:hypothetical protein
MPGFLVHLGASVMCAHAGQAQPTAPNPHVLVGGQPVVTMAAPYAIAACGLTGSGAPPCVTGQWIVAATRVLVGGTPVVLQDSTSTCVPTGTPMSVIVTQVRVKGT